MVIVSIAACKMKLSKIGEADTRRLNVPKASLWEIFAEGDF